MNSYQPRAPRTPFMLLSFFFLAQSCLLRADETAPATAPLLTTTQPPLQTSQTPYSQILAGLASENFQVREAAQKQLEALGWQNLEVLRQLAAAASDPEIKSRLDHRIAAIEDHFAIEPSPILLDLKNASLDQVCAALQTAGAPIQMQPGKPPAPAPTYTLKATNLSFAEILQQLSAQHPFDITASWDSMSLVPQLPSKQIIFSPSVVVAHLWSDNMNGGKHLLGFGIMIDPRVKIAACTSHFDRAEDEFGNKLELNDIVAYYPPAPIWHYSISAKAADASQQIAVAKGVLKVTIALQQETMVLDHPELRLNESFKLGHGGSIVLTSFEASADKVGVSASGRPSDEEINAALASKQIQSPAELIVTGKIIDATGRTVETIAPGMGGSVSCKNIAVMPVKAVLTVAVKTRQVLIPFELHNVSLQAQH